MGHMARLHNEVEKIITEYKREHEEIPEGMQLAYDILHERAMDWAKEVKIMQGMYRE